MVEHFDTHEDAIKISGLAAKAIDVGSTSVAFANVDKAFCKISDE